MDQIRDSILQCGITAVDDDSFVEELNKIIEKEGTDCCQTVIHTLTSLDFPPEDAKKYWSKLLKHREKLANILDRKVTLVTAMSDFFATETKSLAHPKLVEIKTFAKVLEESTHDNLTGLFNRAYFLNTLEHQISISKRHNTDFSLLFFDVDDFKDVNDSFGHQIGDLALNKISDLILQEARDSDVVARYGGEEFVVLMPSTDNMNALVLAERIRDKIEKHKFKFNKHTFQMTISGGLVSYPMHAQTSDGILNLADSAMYRAKGAGKNNISFFREDKRRFLRIKLTSPIMVKELGFNSATTISGTSKDICIGGILFENDQPLVIGARIQVSIPISDKEPPLLLIGTVVRVEAFGPDNYDIGMTISFKEMEKIAKDEISKFLVNRSKKIT